MTGPKDHWRLALDVLAYHVPLGETRRRLLGDLSRLRSPRILREVARQLLDADMARRPAADVPPPGTALADALDALAPFVIPGACPDDSDIDRARKVLRRHGRLS